METYLIVAIDGTNSNSIGYSGGDSEALQMCFENESYTQAFYRMMQIPSSRKCYFPGPGIKKLRGDGYRSDRSKLESIGDGVDAATGASSSEIESAARNWLGKELSKDPGARVVLVGHSRGAHIVTSIAIWLSKFREGDFVPSIRAAPQKLGGVVNHPMPTSTPHLGRVHDQTETISPYPQAGPFMIESIPQIQSVYFLGLYDAVDMTYALGNTAVVPANVVWFFHALRSKKVGSRKGWGNTAVKTARTDKQHYFQQEFDATHGSVGGAFPEACEGNLSGKKAIATAGFALLGSVTGVGGPIAGAALGNTLVSKISSSCEIEISASQNSAAGRQAHAFILDGARNKAKIPMAAK